ncbi:hypothetical protein EDB81DRAFT_761650 [Dactylonectria macrodidyma]|uniref:Uncharacterized protein n=1 Tax=Dactylonectria macrodidyma TaxID=307937 RepID=A0A9P9EI98_9HYPO|nr:hypothetical protein EDB81DRAFT_761650 [Dactylonectria macrodidyma]
MADQERGKTRRRILLVRPRRPGGWSDPTWPTRLETDSMSATIERTQNDPLYRLKHNETQLDLLNQQLKQQHDTYLLLKEELLKIKEALPTFVREVKAEIKKVMESSLVDGKQDSIDPNYLKY